MSFNAINRQKEIYVAGISGHRPLIPTDFSLLERKAKAKMNAKAFAYVAGGAGNESTIVRNRKGFEDIRIWPRMLRDVSVRDTSITLFGQKLPAPFLLAPIGVLDLAHKNGDILVAKAAAKMGVPMIFSNQASVPMEDCAAVMNNNPRFFQLYWSKSDALVASFLQRAEQSGCSAIVVTLDTTMLGWRPRDLNLAYLPFLEGRGIAQYTSDPVFQQLLDAPDTDGPIQNDRQRITPDTISSIIGLMRRYPGSFRQNLRSKRPLKAVRTFINIYSRPSVTWQDIPFLRQHTSLPILLKGILHPDDAKMAIDAGIDGIIVSNHGGRQVDGAISSIEALPKVVKVVDGHIPVLLDSGIRGGADAFKAIALGAKAVLIGRPYVYALAIGGQTGVEEVLKNYISDFELTMGLAGCKEIGECGLNSIVLPSVF